jgi:hypothetical protein
MTSRRIAECEVCGAEIHPERLAELRMVVTVAGQDHDLGGSGVPRSADLCSPACALLRAWALIERAYGRPLMDPRQAAALREGLG